MNSKQSSKNYLQDISGGAEFLEFLATALTNASENDTSVSLALVDLDEFGKINSEYGNEMGDEVLGLTAQFLSQLGGDNIRLFRHSFRAGGDEFVLVMPGVEKEEAFLKLEKCREAFNCVHEIRSISVSTTFSAAVATFPEDGLRPQDVLRKASDAIYRAKNGGRNKVCLAKEERMVTKTSHYTSAQLARLSQLAKREAVGEAVLLREALDELLMKYGL